MKVSEVLYNKLFKNKVLISINGIEYKSNIVEYDLISDSEQYLKLFLASGNSVDLFLDDDIKVTVKPKNLEGFGSHNIPDYADVMTIDEFHDAVKYGSFIDSDGCGYPIVDGKEVEAYCLGVADLATYYYFPEHNVTHVAWYNK